MSTKLINNSSSPSPSSNLLSSRHSAIISIEYITHDPLDPALKKWTLQAGNYLYTFAGSFRGHRWKFKKTFKQIEACLRKIHAFIRKQGIIFAGGEAPSHREPEINSSPDKFRDLVIDWERHINKLLENQRISDSEEMAELIEHAPLTTSFGSEILKQGWIKKRSGGRHKHEQKCFLCYIHKCCRRWKKKWMVVTKQFVCYLRDARSRQINEIMLFDANFQVQKGFRATHRRNGLVIRNGIRSLHISADSRLQMEMWHSAISEAYASSDYNPDNAKNSFNSFAPPRARNLCRWYICGEEYFEAVFNKLHDAKNQIFITDWWLTPTLYLIRPVDLSIMDEHNFARIDKILKTKADQGVKIYILLYKQIEMVLPMKSAYTKKTLTSLSPQIKVVRHPKTLLSFWSHHEKLVIIDQQFAFVGGIDLCFGRFCTRDHPLTDVDQNGKMHMFPGLDYSNVRIKDYYDVDQFQKDGIDRKEKPRMPWQDLAVSVEGQSARDLAHHFIQYFNHAKTESTGTKTKNFVVLRPVSRHEGETTVTEGDQEEKNGTGFEPWDNTKSLQVIEEEMAMDMISSQPRPSLNARVNVTPPIIERRRNTLAVPRIRASLDSSGEKTVSKSPGPKRSNSLQAFKRLNTVHSSPQKSPKKDNQIQELQGIPMLGRMNTEFEKLKEKTSDQLARMESSKREKMKNAFLGFLGVHVPSKQERAKQLLLENYKKSLSKQELEDQKIEEIDEGPIYDVQKVKGPTGTCICQILRSACSWSTGLAKGMQEKSIYEAYITLISYSERFIYIENQFFISNAGGKCGNIVQNRIAEAIVLRIQHAHEAKQKFRVLVCLPLLPGFEGEVDAASSAVLRAQMHYQYQTICRGGNSILERLQRLGVPGKDYIQFIGLRNHAVLNNKPVTQIVYVHSKVMIVDDRYVLIGSANINDRSQLGERDSQIDVLIEDTCTFPLRVADGSIEVQASAYAHEFRTNIMGSHMGIKPQKTADFLSDRLWESLIRQTEINTDIYRELFKCYPDDQILNFQDLKEARESALQGEELATRYEEIKSRIKGFTVSWPLRFLEEEDLRIRSLNKEYYLPEINFT